MENQNIEKPKKKRPVNSKGNHPKKRRKKKKNSIRNYLPHIIILVLVVLIGIIAIWRLSVWNKGQASEYDPNEDTSQWDVETEDYIVPLLDDKKALQLDDGVETVLILGNDPMAINDDGTGIPDYIRQKTGANVVNASFEHSTIAKKNMQYTEDYLKDAISFAWVCYCIAHHDFLLQKNAVLNMGDSGTAMEKIQNLENLDYSTVDTIVIMYDGKDYEEGLPSASIYDDELPASAAGCLHQGLQYLSLAMPQARVIISSPYYYYVEDPENEDKYVPCTQAIHGEQGGDVNEFKYGNLGEYMIAYKSIAVGDGVSFIDNYFGTVNEDNYATMLKDDNTQLSSDGRDAIGQRIVDFMKM